MVSTFGARGSPKMESICLKTMFTCVPFSVRRLPVRKKKGTSRKRSVSTKKAPEAKVSVIDSGSTFGSLR